MVALRRFVARAAAAKPFASTTATSVASCSSATPDWYAIPYQCIRHPSNYWQSQIDGLSSYHVQRTRFTNPIDKEMRQMVAKENKVASSAAQSALVGLPDVGVAKGKREITVPVADLKWEDMHPGSPVKFSVLWGDHKKGPFGMLLKQPGGGFEAGMHTHATDYH